MDTTLLMNMLADIESERVERTISTSDTEKFCKAICAFSNDMSASGEPGYLIIGSDDASGAIANIDVTDELLLNLSSHADSGRIIPLPVMTVEKVELDEGDVVVITVQPSDMPPVRYKGRTWIRRGPRKALANEQEERILTEKRSHKAPTFDLRPCIGCGKDEMVLRLYELDYRDAAIAPDIVQENKRDTMQQMASLGLWEIADQCASNVGALLFAESPLNWIPGAYIQYVHYSGNAIDSQVLDEKIFSGDLISMLRALDSWLETLFSKRPESVSALREKSVTPYPTWAIRELLMNAIMHRDYESTMPIRFTRFSDRIEIMNPGGLYNIRPENFPRLTSYRNPKVAEVLYLLKYVNRFGHGVQQTQRLLEENGNRPAEFKVDEPAYFLATVYEGSS